MSRLDEIKAVKQLGEAIGYGNMMDIASALWSKKVTKQTGRPCMMHIPTVEGYLTEEGKEVAHVGLNARLEELKKLENIFNITEGIV